MFRLNKTKRSFSFGSPSKLSLRTLSPRCSKMQPNSPAKRLKLSDQTPLLSSTFLQEINPIEEDKSEKLKIDTTRIGTGIDKSIIPHVSQNEITVQTPPPTPEVRSLTRIEFLLKRKSKLIDDGSDLDKEIEAKFHEIEKLFCEIEAIKASRFVYDDYVNIVTLSQKEMRDKMNQIFAPGNEFGQKFEVLMREIHAKHARKLEKKSLELSSYVDQTKSAIVRKMEDLTHEIDLHQRTLLHREHLSTKSNGSNDPAAAEKETNEPANKDINISSNEAEEGKILEENKNVQNKSKNVQDNKKAQENKKKEDGIHSVENDEKTDTDDCIIIENGDIANEEIINDQSIETIEAKMEEDETDIDDNSSSDEPVRSFTPCQAQRLE